MWAGHGTHAPDAAGTDCNEHRGNASSRTGYTNAYADGNGDDGAVNTCSDDGNEHPRDHRRRDSRGAAGIRPLRLETLG